VSVGAGEFFIHHPVKGTVYAISGKAIGRWLYNPRTARALAEGIRIPVSETAATRIGAIAYLLKLAGEQGRLVHQE
jgi:hypothetical protein